MAIARFHSLRGEKSALILVKANGWVFNFTPVYVPRAQVMKTAGVVKEEDIKEGFEFTIPDGYKLADILDLDKDGNVQYDDDGVVKVRTTEEGVPLKTLAY